MLVSKDIIPLKYLKIKRYPDHPAPSHQTTKQTARLSKIHYRMEPL
jgi:hypothetical protein